MKTDCDVVVVGLGPAGTLTSLLLSDSSIKVIGIDKEKEIYSLPRAVTIDDEGLRTLQRLNLENIYLENGTAIEGAYFLDDKLQKLSGMDVPANFLTSNGWMPNLMFHQPFTDALLREELLKSSCFIKLETELIEIVPIENYYIVKTLNLTNGKEDSFTAKYVVGADGASSKVRNLMEFDQEDLDYDKNWLVVDVKLKVENTLPTFAAQICNPKRICTYIPAHLPFRRWEFILLEGESKEEMLKETTIQKLISPWLKPNEYEIIRAAVYRFHSLLTTRFKKGNCFVIGDAAHQNPPFMGQGMMSGYRDALNLSWKLISVIINSFPKELLESYEEERKPHSRFVVEGSAAIGKLMSSYAEAIAKGNPSDVPQELVDRGYGSFSLPPLEKGLFYKGYSDTDSMAGNLFPQPLSMEGIMCKERLDSLLGKGFCVVSTKEVELMPYQKKFYEIINSNFLVIEKSMLNDNPWLNKTMSKNDIYILRPDRHIFGSTSDKITFEDLTEDLRERLSL